MRSRRACRLTSGDRFPSKRAAEDAEFARKVNNVASGQRVPAVYMIVPCRCNGWHLTTTEARDGSAGGSSP